MENDADIIRRRRRREEERRKPNWGKKTKKINLLEELSEEQLKQHTKFSKRTIKMLANTFRDELTLEARGCPISPENTVVVGLAKLASGSLNRITGLVANRISTETARLAVQRFINALFFSRDRYMKPPTLDQLKASEYRMWLQYGIQGLSVGIDGVHFRFESAPRSNEQILNTQEFWCRKQFFSLNVLVLGDDQYAYYVDPSYPGSVHDSRVYNNSQAKDFVDDLPEELFCAGDSGYPISRNMIVPFKKNELNGDNQKALFNGKLSQVRTKFTEVRFGRIKNQYRILRCLRSHLELSQRTIVACFILRNIAFQQKEEIAEEIHSSDEEDLDSDADHDGDDWNDTDSVINPRTEYLDDDPEMAAHHRNLEASAVNFPRVLDRGPLSQNAANQKRIGEGKLARENMLARMQRRGGQDRNIRNQQ